MVDTLSVELATRLSEVGLRTFVARPDGTVVPEPHGGSYVPLRVLRAGRGRPYEVRHALDEPSGHKHVVATAGEFSPGALDLLREADANYMDRRRLHVRLEAPEYLVHVVDAEERFIAQEADAEIRLSGAAGGVVMTLLEPFLPEASHANEWKVTELAEEVRSSPATIQRVIFALEAEGLVEAVGSGPAKTRSVLDATMLLDRYAADAARDRRQFVTLFVLPQRDRDLAEAVGRRLASSPVSAALTGYAAAAREAPGLTRVPIIEFWVDGNRTPEYLAQIVDGMVTSDGPNVKLWLAGTKGPMARKHRRRAHGKGIRPVLASPFRVYADLLASHARGKEQAEVYRDTVIGF